MHSGQVTLGLDPGRLVRRLVQALAEAAAAEVLVGVGPTAVVVFAKEAVEAVEVRSTEGHR